MDDILKGHDRRDFQVFWSNCFSLISNRPFLSCFEPHYESEAKCKVSVIKIRFHSYANKTNLEVLHLALLSY